VIRPATVEDVPAIVDLIVELATYEREAEQAQATVEQLESALFAPEPAVYCLVVEDDAGPGSGGGPGPVVGFALWFRTFSTWLGRHGIYLEDLFVQPSARRAGHGRALLAELARIAVERGYGRVEWAVLNWNSDAQSFYTSIGAQPMDEWTTWRLTGDALPALGGRAQPRVK
jgi:GNAT superfamily N-acetyltransferase